MPDLRILFVPKSGLVIRDPVSGRVVPPSGILVQDSKFWRRRAAEGSGEIADGSTPVSRPPDKQKEVRRVKE
jgi:hypothetical protein